VPIAALTRRVEVLLGDDFLRLGSEAGVFDLPSSAGFEPAQLQITVCCVSSL
jgi:hypothetical protein